MWNLLESNDTVTDGIQVESKRETDYHRLLGTHAKNTISAIFEKSTICLVPLSTCLTMRIILDPGCHRSRFCSQRRNDMLCVVRSRRTAVWLGVAGLLLWGSVGNALGQVDWKKEWERSLQETKREGEIVVGIPARPELRKQLELIFKPKFGIGMELLTARGPQNASRIASEYKAGVRYFDVFIGGSGTFESLVDEGMVEPFPHNMILP